MSTSETAAANGSETAVSHPSLPIKPVSAAPSGDAFPATLPPVTLPALSPTGSRAPAALRTTLPMLEGMAVNDIQWIVLYVKPGQDVGETIMKFGEESGKDVIVLAGSGSISTATLGIDTNGPITIYEGGYELFNISGSYMLEEVEGRESALSVKICGADAHVIDGCLAGPLVAAARVQVVVGSFTRNKNNQKESETRKNHVENESGGCTESWNQDSISA